MEISKKRLTARIIFTILSVAIMVAIIIFSSESGNQSSQTSTGFIATMLRIFYPGFKAMTEVDQLAIIDSIHLFVRKWAHFSIYAMLGLTVGLTSLTYICKKMIRPLVSFGICVVYAISDEIHQAFVPMRVGAATDVLIDSCGAALGVAIAIFVFGFFFRKHIISSN